MAASLATNVSITLGAILTQTVGLAPVSAPILRQLILALPNGVGANQADKVYSETKTIVASGTYDLDLAGTILDVFGAVCTFARVKLVAIFADGGNTNNVLIGAAAATQFIGPLGSATDKINVRPGGCSINFAPDATGWPVGAGATDFLRFTNSAAGTSVLFDILIVGASA
jgi:hypothetical protein